MRKWLLVLLVLGALYHVFTHYPVLDAVLGRLTEAQMKALIDEQNRPGTGFAERMKASAEGFLERRYGPPATAKPQAQVGAPPPNVPTPEELRARDEAERKKRIERLLSPDPGALTTASGLVYKKTHLNSEGVRPSLSGGVLAHFTVWTSDGELFETTRKDYPRILYPNRLVPGLREGILLMRQGEAASFWIPTHLAYGKVPERVGAPAGPLRAHVIVLEVVEP